MLTALLLHVGPDHGAHDLLLIVLGLPWSVVVGWLLSNIKRRG